MSPGIRAWTGSTCRTPSASSSPTWRSRTRRCRTPSTSRTSSGSGTTGWPPDSRPPARVTAGVQGPREAGSARAVRGAGLRQGALGLALVLPPLLVLAFLVALPAVTAVIETLTPAGGGGPTLANYARVLAARTLRADIVFTVGITLVSVAVVFALSYPLALYLRFSRGRAARLLGVLFVVPLFVPVVIAS